MSQGLFVEDDKDEDEDESGNEGMPAGPVRAVDRKTKQQRRKEKEQQEEVNNFVNYLYLFTTQHFTSICDFYE